MKKDFGWVSVHRSIVSHWIFSNAEYFRAWINMLIAVNYEDKKTLINGELIECKRGQSVMSMDSWVKEFKHDWTIKKVRHFFSLLEKDNMIKKEGLKYTTKITIINYEKYQVSLTKA